MATRFGSIARGLVAETPIESCDRCGVRAWVRVTLYDGGVLYFCKHHASEYHEALKRVAYSQEELPL